MDGDCGWRCYGGVGRECGCSSNVAVVVVVASSSGVVVDIGSEFWEARVRVRVWLTWLIGNKQHWKCVTYFEVRRVGTQTHILAEQQTSRGILSCRELLLYIHRLQEQKLERKKEIKRNWKNIGRVRHGTSIVQALNRHWAGIRCASIWRNRQAFGGL